MFKNTFQSGFLSILYSLGTKPLQIWDKEVVDGHIKRPQDEDIKSNVLEIVGTNVQSTYITCPADPAATLGIKLPFLALVVKNLKKYFTFEVQVLDDKNVRRRFRASNFQSVTRVKPYICTMPLKLDDGWNNIQLNLTDLTKRAYGTNYVETLRVQVHANCRLRRVYFSDRLYSEEELPAEFKLYLPIQESEADTSSSNLAAKFDRILSRAFAPSSANMSTVFRSAPKGRRVSIHAFEVAHTIVRASCLINSLSKQRIRHLKEGVLRSEGVRCLISEDYSLLSVLIEDDIREELRGLCKEVARFGDLCEGPQWHNLSRCFCRSASPLASKKFGEEAPPSMQYLTKLEQNTWVLRQEMLALDRLEHAHYVAAIPVKKQIDAIKSQRGAVKVLKRKSLWSKSMEDIVEKLVEIVGFIHHEINNAFLENHAEQSSGELRIANNLAKTLGPAGLALHYANVILQLKTLALASPAVPQNAREALYQALPPRIKPVLHTQLRRRFPLGEKQTMTVAEVRAEMDRVLRWLVPAAESTRLYLREWAMKGTEWFDVDETNWFEQENRISVGSMLAHAYAKVSKVETLYYADKETTEGYIAELVLALHLLVSLPTDEKWVQDEGGDEQLR